MKNVSGRKLASDCGWKAIVSEGVLILLSHECVHNQSMFSGVDELRRINSHLSFSNSVIRFNKGR